MPVPIDVDPVMIGQWVGHHLLPLFRVASFMMTLPLLGTQLVPMRVRILFALLFTLLIVPWLPPGPTFDAVSLAMIPLVLEQILIGSALGFAVIFLFQLFVVGGQMVAMQMGLGFASMVDPANGVSVPVLAQFYLITVNLLFLAMNGHLVAFEVFAESFRALPIGEGLLGAGLVDQDLWWLLAHRITWLFVAAMMLALPAMTAVLIVNIAFGVMTKAAPQMNIFSLGFPIGLLFGLLAVWVMHSGFQPQFQILSEETFAFMRELQRLP